MFYFVDMMDFSAML